MEDLLYLVHRIPYPPNKGDKIRSWHMLRHLAERYRVHLGTFVDDPADWEHVDTLRAVCAETHFAPLNPVLARLRSAAGLFTGEPLTLPYYRDAGLARWVQKILRDLPVRRILVFSSAMAQYVMDAAHCRRIMDFVDVDSDKWTQYAGSKGWPMSWVYRREGRRLLDYERRVATRFDASFFVSAAEAEMFRGLAPETASRVSHFSNGVDCDYFSPEREYADPFTAGELPLVFVGAMDYWANVDAVNWFAREILPRVLDRVPGARFYVVGARPVQEVQALARLAGVVVTGGVPDVRPYLAHAGVVVAPLRIARGIQNKVLEAMAMARAVVASPQAAEGIEAQPGRELYVEADVPAFAQRVADALTAAAGDARLLGAAARARVLERYGWAANLASLGRALEAGEPPALRAGANALPDGVGRAKVAGGSFT